MGKSTSRPLNVFIGCPGDMAAERAELLKLRDHLGDLGLHVRFLIWKNATPGAGDAQKVIFDNYPIGTWDIFIGLLWTRFGVPSGDKDPISGETLTGTEAEFSGAYDAWKASGGVRPQVLLYRCVRHLPANVDTRQLDGVRKFFEQTQTGGSRPALTQDFKTAKQLCRMVVPHIKTVIERLASEKKSSAPASPKKRTHKASAPVPDSGTLLHRYFAGLRDQFAIYENLGLPVPERDGKEGEKDAPIPIRRLFVEPACTDAHFRPEAFDAALREGKNPAKLLLPYLAPAKSHTVLLADPGMGKSTLIQWLISTLADEAVPPGAEALRGAIPLPFILRDLVGHLPQDVTGWNWDALVDAFRQWRHRGKGAPLAAPLTADDAYFRSILGSADAFFLVDGLDEIGDPQRRLAIRDSIWEGFEKYPKARWLITSRIVGYEQAEVDRKWVRVASDSPQPTVPLFTTDEEFDSSGVPGFVDSVVGFEQPVKGKDANDLTPHRRHDLKALATRLHLTPFDNEQQLAFARNWYVPRLGDAAGTQRADDFIAAVHRNDHTRVISRVPNLLYLLALLFRHRARLPDGRALVYAAISSAYLADIDLGRHLPDSLIVPWKFEEKEDLLALVAMRMQEIRVEQAWAVKREVLVTRAQLEEWLSPRFGGAGDAEACAGLHRFLDHIANRSGLLLPRGEGVFGFAHLSFQEYYAACFLEKEFQRILTQKAQPAGGDLFGTSTAAGRADEEKMFAEMAALPAWHEPLLFLVEKLRHSVPYTSRILGWAFPQLATEPKGKDWMPFTTAQLLAGISLDQEVSLDAGQRGKLWTILWRAHLAQQQPTMMTGGGNWHLAPSLLGTSTYQAEVLQALATLRREPIDQLNLAGCTAVSDLQPLHSLVSLQWLWLNGCTAVSDLQPLRDLSSLQWLTLDGCTAVSDLQPLLGLGSLQWLNLNGCTAVSDKAVAALKASLPNLKIYR